MKAVILAIAMTLVTLPGAPQAQTAADLGDGLRAMHLDPGFRQTLRDRGFTGDKFEAMIEHMRLLYGDAAIVSGVMARVAERLPRDRPVSPEIAMLVSSQVLDEAQQRGFQSLSANGRWAYYANYYAFLRSLSPSDCGAYVTDRMSPARGFDLFDRFMAAQSAAYLRGFYATIRQATTMGLSRRAVPQLSRSERLRAEELMMTALDREMQSHPDARRLFNLWSGNAMPSPRDACTFALVSGRSVSGLPPRDRDLVLRRMFE